MSEQVAWAARELALHVPPVPGNFPPTNPKEAANDEVRVVAATSPEFVTVTESEAVDPTGTGAKLVLLDERVNEAGACPVPLKVIETVAGLPPLV